MATLRDIKLRIKGVKSTQQITKAMKMVAAAKLRRAQERVMNARPYAREIGNLIARLVSEDDLVNNPYIAPRDVKSVALVIVTADRGLCGAFNSNLIKESQRYLNEELLSKNITPYLYCIGKKGLDFFNRTQADFIGKKPGIFQALNLEAAFLIARDLIDGYLNNKYDKVTIIYNEFKSIIQQKIVIEDFLPVPVLSNENDSKLKAANYIYEPEQKMIFNSLLPKHLNGQIWRILLESNSSELAARMTAMDNATTNAKELIRTLQLKFNRERQAAITKEILEVVSGANALKES